MWVLDEVDFSIRAFAEGVFLETLVAREVGDFVDALGEDAGKEEGEEKE